jgi:two-component system sensor kinase FixL
MSHARRYGMALLLVAASLAIRLPFAPVLGAKVPFLQFFPAILLAAWWGGLGPGLVAVATCAVVAVRFFLPPVSSMALADPSDAVSLLLFVASGAGISWFGHRLRRSEAASRTAVARDRARSQELQTILDTAVDGIIVIDARGHIESFNRGAERLFGYAAAEVVGRNVSLLMPSPDHERHDDYLARYLTSGEARIIGVGRAVTGRHRDGRALPLHLSVGEMTIGGVRKFTGLLHDLSIRTQHEARRRESEARWRSIVESAVDGIVVIDQHGRIESFNPAAERLFGYAEADIIGQNVRMLMPSPYREEHDGYLARYLATGTRSIIGRGREVQGLRRDGTIFPLHLSVGEASVGGERRFTGILHDLTARTEMERQLREQAALARLGEMAAVVAHEVKNPLAGIRGAVQVIGGRLPAGSMDRKMAHEIVARIDGLSDLMKEMLLFARPPTPRPHPIDLTRLVSATAQLLREDAAARGVAVQVEGTAPPAMADASLLQIVFQNLLINAAQAMQGQGEIRVSVRAVDAMCEVAFRDAGPGIPADLRPRIFVPFFTTKSRGSGLGLPTCRRLVEAHQGTIAVDCPIEGGTTVTVSLPAASPPP